MNPRQTEPDCDWGKSGGSSFVGRSHDDEHEEGRQDQIRDCGGH